MDKMDLAEVTRWTEGVAWKAGDEILMRNYRKMQKLEWELRTNFKTAVDDESDQFIRAAIEERFSEHGILSEETRDKQTPSRYRWVVDPLDGTINYAFGISDLFAVSIALCDRDDPIVGVVYAPLRQEIYSAYFGGGATLNGKLITVSRERDFRKVIMNIEHGKMPGRQQSPELQMKLLPDDGGVTAIYTVGCASVSLAFAACGKFHAAAAVRAQPWDIAAAVVICREAGARVTTIAGDGWHLDDWSILVANSVIHDWLLAHWRQ